jgi:hypothetical protein
VVSTLDVGPALRDLLGGDPRGREHLRQIGAGQPLDRAGVRDLVDATADEQVAGQCARGGMLHHLVHLELVVPCARLEEEVVRQVLYEVARREDVVAGPGPALRVLRQRSLAAGEEVMRVPDVLELGERALPRAPVRRRGAGEHRVDRGCNQLDVPELLGCDVRDEVVERPRALPVAEVEGLEHVVHERRHLAEAPAHELLHHRRAGGVGL